MTNFLLYIPLVILIPKNKKDVIKINILDISLKIQINMA